MVFALVSVYRIIIRWAMEEFEELYASEQACFGGSWTREMLRSELENPLTVLVFERVDGIIASFAFGRVAVDEAELFQIGTLPEYRGRGLAKSLLERLHDKMRERGAAVCFLEVRSRNAAAIALYEKSGYERISVRRNYYPDDDAIVMKRMLL